MIGTSQARTQSAMTGDTWEAMPAITGPPNRGAHRRVRV